MEAEVLNEITLEKPVLDTEIYVNIPETLEVKHNLNNVRDYVKKLNEFYGNIINIDVDFATSERTKLNQLLKQVENLRKEKVAEFKKPIDDFESTAKETEKDLKSIIESMKLIIDKEKQRLADEKFKNVIQPIIKDLCAKAFIDFGFLVDENIIEINQKWYNKTYSTKDIESDIKLMIEEDIKRQQLAQNDINTITQTLSMCDKENKLNKEVYLERYKYTGDLNLVLNAIKTDLDRINTVVEKPVERVSIEKPNVLISRTFTGTKEQIDLLTTYAISLGMEVK
nr:MAG TPA: Protein of unknown function (DUF1351) [Caudoviricetes sp.]